MTPTTLQTVMIVSKIADPIKSTLGIPGVSDGVVVIGILVVAAIILGS